MRRGVRQLILQRCGYSFRVNMVQEVLLVLVVLERVHNLPVRITRFRTDTPNQNIKCKFLPYT